MSDSPIALDAAVYASPQAELEALRQQIRTHSPEAGTASNRSVPALKQHGTDSKGTQAARPAAPVAEAAQRLQRLAENRLGTLYRFRLAPDGAASFPYISPGCRCLLGLEPEAVMRDASLFLNLTHPDDLERFRTSVAQSAAELTPWLWEGRLLLTSGTIKWIQGEAHPVREADGAIAWDGWLLDITRHKDTEARWQAAGDRLAKVLEGTSDAFFALDRDWRFVQVNRHAERLLGAPARDLVGQSIWERFPAAVDSTFYRQYHQAVEQHQTVTFEEYYPPLDAWFEVRAYPVDEDLFVYFTEISDRKHLEARVAERTAELERATAQLEAILNNSPAVIYVKDLEGRYLLANQKYQELFQRTPAEILGKTDRDFFAPEIAVAFWSNDQNVLASGKALYLEEVAPHADGLHTYVSVKFPLLDETGQPYAVCGISTDITERQQAAAQLQAALALQNAIFDSTLYSIIATDTDGTIRSFNTAAEKLTGYSAAEMVGFATPARLHDPEEVAARTQDLNAELGFELEPGFETLVAKARRGEPDEREWTYLRKDGSRVPVLLSVTALRDEAGEIAGFVGLASDISDRQRAEQELLLYKQAVESSNEAIAIADANGCHRYHNAAFSALYGFTTPEEVNTWGGLARATPPSAEALELFQALRAGQAWVGEVEQRDRRDRTFPALIRANAIRNAAGDIVGSIGIITDVTERKQAEVTQQRLVATIENSSDFIGLADLEGRSEYLNAAGQKLVGLPDLAAALRLSMFEFIPAEYRDRFESEVVATVMERGSWRGEFALHHFGTGAAIEVEMNLFLIYHPKTQEPLCFATVTRDITERREAEQTLHQQKQDLEDALRELQATQANLIQSEKMSSLGQLVAGIAHEINNPVNFIYGNLVHTKEYADNLLAMVESYREHYPEPPEALQELAEDLDLEFTLEDFPRLLNSMKVGAQRIREIVASLRTFSRLDEAECKEADIHEGLDSTLLILQNRLKAKSDRPAIEVVKEYGPLSRVECYPGQLNQVFMNILVNALDALEERDGKRSPEANKAAPSRIYITTAEEQSGWLTIRLRDNGPGMSEAVRQRIFDPFFTTKATGKGTGLGMSISYQIITERHGGTLSCSSELGQGAEFAIAIPVRQPDTHQDP